jgi:hypothetical protein
MMSVLLVLVFSIRPVVLSVPHFLVPEARRSVCIAQPEPAPTECIAHQALLLLRSVDTRDPIEPAVLEIPSPVPLSRLLMRLKLGSSHSSGPDPLL